MSNVNSDTVQYISSNLETIFDGFSKYQIEDGSKDKDNVVTNWVQYKPTETRPEVNFGEGPMYIEQDYEILVTRKITGKDDHRNKAAEIIFELEENITVDALNVGGLADSRLVTKKAIETNANDYRGSEGLEVTAVLTVTFRDSRS